MKLGLKLSSAWLACAAFVGWVNLASADYAPLPFQESFESSILNTNYWTLQGTWGLTTEAAHTGANSLTDSPRSVYTNNTDASAILSVDLRSAWAPVLQFWNRYAFEANRDFGFLEVSSDFGASWTRWGAVTGQGGTNWYPVQLDLTPYAGAMVMIRFHLSANGANAYDGWYIDDVSVTENTALAIYPFFDNMDGSATNWLACGWQQVPGGAQGVGGRSWQCRIGDNGYTPGGSLQQVLTLAPALNMSLAAAPRLSFWWRAGSMANNTLYAQASRDGGMTWNTVWSWNSNWYVSAPWSLAQVDLSAYQGYPEVTVRFLAYNTADNINLDFQVDNVLVDEAPADVTLTASPGTDPRHSAQLNWTQSASPTFAYYSIFRSTSSGVTPASQLVATFTNRTTLSFQDTNLAVCGQTYYYRVLVWETNGLHNWGLADTTYRTSWGQRVSTFPFVDSLETSDANWALDWPWGLTGAQSRTGTNSLTDSPGANYANNTDASATLHVYLAGINRPLLTYWQIYSLELNRDFGFVEISGDNGASWSRVAGVTGYGGTNWQQQQIDLTPWAGVDALVRFRLKSSASVQDDGWYLDDLSITDNGQVAAYPFTDNMDTQASATNWLTSAAWLQVPGSAQTNTGASWQCRVGDNGYNPGGIQNNYYQSVLTLNGKLNLQSALKPLLSFWWRAGTMPNNTLYAQMSQDGGKSWNTVWSWNSNWYGSAGWNRVQVDLGGYLGYTNAALRFVAYNDGNNFNLDFQIDQVSVSETPAPPPESSISVAPGPDPRHSATLTWSNSLAPSFAYYGVYRSTSPGVSISSTLVAAITNQLANSFMDTNLDVCGQTYYYRLIVWNSSGLHSTGSDLPYRTAWGTTVTSFPFTDGMEGSDAAWALDRPWALATDRARTGTHSLTDSPGGNYANSTDASATLHVYLAGINRPLLTYWQLYSLELNRDFGFVEISDDNGNSWTRLAGVTGYGGTNWQQQQIDLTPYAGKDVLVHFRLKSNGSVQDDGWYLDDLSITDNSLVAGYPFHDSMDSPGSVSNWLAVAAWQWVGGSAQTNSGGSWQCRIGDNGYNPGGVQNNYYQSILTLAGRLSFAAATNPRLSFWWRAGSMANNTLSAQTSKDGGKSWSTVWSWNSNWYNSAGWNRVQVDLTTISGYLGSTNVALRFVTYNDGNNFNLDFQIDQVVVDEAPADVTYTATPGPDPRHSALITWSPSAAPDFAYYAVYRSTSAGVTPSSTLLTNITSQSVTNFLDTGLDVCGQTYYYRVMVWDNSGLHSWGTADATYRTAWGQTVTSFPFSDGMEGSDAAWALDRPWALATDRARTGIRCLTDSPGGNYANNTDASATLKVYLNGMSRPLLSYWQLYSLELNRDFGFVEISTDDGNSWTRVAGVTGYGGINWVPQQVDLTPWSGSTALLRFRLKSNGSVQDDGWYLDDLSITDNSKLVGYPFYDGMDNPSSGTNWLASAAWQWVGGSAQTNAGGNWQCRIGDNGYNPGGIQNNYYQSILTLAERLNLAAAINPRLSFWWRAGTMANNTLYAQMSKDGGKSWNTVWSWNSNWYNSAGWNRVQVDLSAYLGYTNATLRFVTYNDGNNFNLDFQIDQVLVDEARNDLVVTAVAGPEPQHSATLSWTAASGQNFAYYAIYRSTTPGVTPASTLVATIPNRSTLSYTDSSLPQCGQNYYYRVLAYYSDGYTTTGTTDTVYRTSWAATITALPFTEQFEVANSYWSLDWPWGTTSQQGHSGTHALTDSPGTLYANNTDRSATLRVDLRLANRPALSFWQMYDLELNRDYALVEISSNDGTTWTTAAAVTGHAGWGQTRIDLGPYVGTIALIRWHLKTDNQNMDDGWYLDDVAINENPAVTTYPFYDSVDDPQRWTNWIASSWTTVGSSAQDLPGFSWRCLTGDGSTTGSNYFNAGLTASLTLAGTLDLKQASVPKLWFWWRAGQQWYHTLAAQVSPDGGRNWNTVWIVNTLDSPASAWQQAQVVLTNTAGLSQVGLRFVASNPGNTPAQLDFQVDQVLVGERDGPTILTASPLTLGTLGASYSVALLATNGTAPYSWSVVTNTLPPGLQLNPITGLLAGTPTNVGEFMFWVRVSDNAGHMHQKPFSLVVQSAPPPVATQSSQPFVSPGTNVVFCQVTSQTVSQLLALAWSPTLPAGWTVIGVSGDGTPTLGLDGNITLLGSLSGNPLNFNYTVRIPSGQAQGGVIAGTVTYQYAGMPTPATVPAQPQLLSVSPRVYHSADCNKDWIIGTTEANQVIAYWRAGAYQTYAFSCDGYTPGQGNRVGPLHSADYAPPYWQIDGDELNRVLAYWRAGCYHADTNTLDGYALGCASVGMIGNVAHSAASFYSPGSLVTVTNSVQYSGSLLSLLWRPGLPAGWTLQSVSGDGNPELLNGDITWTSPSLPPSPIRFNYVVQVAQGDSGLKQIRGEVDYMLSGGGNALQTFANPDPLVLNANIVTPILISSIARLTNGAIQLGLQGTTAGNVRVQYSVSAFPTAWDTLATLPPLAGSAVFTDTAATNSVSRFYRLVSP